MSRLNSNLHFTGVFILAAVRVIRRADYQRPIPPPLPRQSAKRTDIRITSLRRRSIYWRRCGASKLARDEAEARMTLRLHRQHMGIASFLAHLCDAVRAADQKPRLDDADIKKQPDPENGHAYPQSALPG